MTKYIAQNFDAEAPIGQVGVICVPLDHQQQLGHEMPHHIASNRSFHNEAASLNMRKDEHWARVGEDLPPVK
jgi:hypothetical protein